MNKAPLKPNARNRYLSLWEFANCRSQVESSPYDLQIARSNHCNFKCVYCVDHRAGNTVPRSRLGDNEWQSLFDLIPKCEVMAFHGISEFMIDPQFFDIAERCGKAGVELSINTNGSVASPKHLETLANYPAHLTFNVSIDAATPETFERVRGWDFNRLLSNIEAYTKAFEARTHGTSLNFSFVILKSTVREMVPFLHLAKSFKADAVSYYPLHDYKDHDWIIEAGRGVAFDYRAEHPSNFPAEYDAEIRRTREIAKVLEMNVNLPAPFNDPEPAGHRPGSGSWGKRLARLLRSTG